MFYLFHIFLYLVITNYFLIENKLEVQFPKFRNIIFSVQNRIFRQLSPLIPLLQHTILQPQCL